MAKAVINGEVISGSTSYASAITYTKEDGTKSTVQNELDELNTNIGKDVNGVTVNEKLDLLLQSYNNKYGLVESIFLGFDTCTKTRVFTKRDNFTECYVVMFGVNDSVGLYADYTVDNLIAEDVYYQQNSKDSVYMVSRIVKVSDIKEGSSITMNIRWGSMYMIFA